MGNDKDQKVVVKPKKKWLSRKKLIIIVAIAIIIIGGAVSAWFFISGGEKSSSTINNEISQTTTNANKLAYDGKVSDAEATYDNAIKKTDDPYQKSILLVSKATLSFNIGKYDEALVIAKKAEAIDQNDTVLSFIAQIYEKKSDSKNAIKYYQKAIASVSNSDPTSSSTIEYYKYKVKSLSAVES